MYAKYMKRLLDILLSLTILVVLSPLLLVLCILVRSKLGSPIFFKQERPGLHEKIFTMYKFRTMTDKRDVEGNLLPDKDRLTKFGKLLRATSLDELPEFFNILKGDMSCSSFSSFLICLLSVDSFIKRSSEASQKFCVSTSAKNSFKLAVSILISISQVLCTERTAHDYPFIH